MINIKKERNKVIKEIRRGEKMGSISHKQGKEMLKTFDKNCKENKNRFDKREYDKRKIQIS